MKIKPGAYKEEMQIETYLRFSRESSRYISLVFGRRYAAYIRDMHQIARGLFGSRAEADQSILYRSYILYKQGKGPYAVPAAAPGVSKHQYGLALDAPGEENPVIKAVAGVYLMDTTARQQEIARIYGIILPLNRIDNKSQQEDWHYQPVETIGLGSPKGWLDADDAICYKPVTIRPGTSSIWASEWTRLTGLAYNAVNAEKWQRANDLTPDTVIGAKSWRVAYQKKGIVMP